MQQADKDRIRALVDSAANQLDKSAAYDAIAFAERAEQDPATRQLLHEAALELMRSHHDHTEIAKVRELIDAIKPHAS